MKKFGRLALIGVLILGLMAFSIGCGSTEKTTTGDADKAAKKILKVGSEAAYPPFEIQDKDGKFVGFDMDLIRAIAQAEGYEVEISNLPFTGLIPALKAGNVDAAISAMTITDKRRESIDFSEPYIDSGQIISMRSDDSRPLTKLEDLKGLTIAVQLGTTGEDQAKKVVAMDPKTTIKKYESVNEAFLELKNKGADVAIVDQPVTLNYISKGHPEIKMVGKTFTDEKYGIAINKGNKEILDLINDGLKKVKASGEYDRIYKKHIGG
ncbi:MAG: basic amino acid ABC transporter substrate-binding protein [Acidobacteriota bacterium]